MVAKSVLVLLAVAYCVAAELGPAAGINGPLGLGNVGYGNGLGFQGNGLGGLGRGLGYGGYAYPRYRYAYGVNDHYTGDMKQAEEERDGNFVRGQYSVVGPHGGWQRFTYVRDGLNKY